MISEKETRLEPQQAEFPAIFGILGAKSNRLYACMPFILVIFCQIHL